MGMRGPKKTSKIGHTYGDYKVIEEFKDPNNVSNRNHYVICECTGCGDIRKIREDHLKRNMICKRCSWDDFR